MYTQYQQPMMGYSMPQQYAMGMSYGMPRQPMGMGYGMPQQYAMGMGYNVPQQSPMGMGYSMPQQYSMGMGYSMPQQYAMGMGYGMPQQYAMGMGSYGMSQAGQAGMYSGMAGQQMASNGIPPQYYGAPQVMMGLQNSQQISPFASSTGNPFFQFTVS